jgi:hypothetical protein
LGLKNIFLISANVSAFKIPIICNQTEFISHFREMKRRVIMNLARTLIFGLCLTLMSVGYVAVEKAHANTDRQDVIYSCDCGSGCNCNSVSTQPGKCACGKELKWGHVLKIEGDEALLCQCEEGCECSLSESDPTKCACGNDVKRVKLAGSGLHFCNCGGSCYCNTVSDQPGKCKCGMELKKVD